MLITFVQKLYLVPIPCIRVYIHMGKFLAIIITEGVWQCDVYCFLGWLEYIRTAVSVVAQTRVLYGRAYPAAVWSFTSES